MKPRLFALMLLIVSPVIAGAVSAEDRVLHGASSTTPYTRFLASQDDYYRDPILTMKTLIASQQKNSQINHFCLVGYEHKGNISSGHVWVHWQEEKMLKLWDGSLDPYWRAIGLTTSRRTLRLGKDTVKTEDDIGGSTYLITEQAWHDLANDCGTYGEKYIIYPFRARPRPKRNDFDDLDN